MDMFVHGTVSLHANFTTISPLVVPCMSMYLTLLTFTAGIWVKIESKVNKVNMINRLDRRTFQKKKIYDKISGIENPSRMM